jgi:hypothetical protein
MVAGQRHLGQVQQLAKKWPDFLDFRWMQNVHSGGKFAVQDRPGEILREKCGVKKL